MPSVDLDLIEDTHAGLVRSAPWPLLARLPALLLDAQGAPAAYRDLLRQAHDDLQARFLAEEPVETLVHARAALIDTVLREVWRTQLGAAGLDWTLVAVGGYGRAELHPASDIDLLVLVPAAVDPQGRSRIEALVAFLWDIGLEVGHSVRTVEECVQESAPDVGVMTTLLEARCISGDAQLFEAMRAALAPERVWPVREFFEAKLAEQAERHLKANDTAYNLEPNVKTGPGGLRDIQTIAWVAKRHFGANTLDELARQHFLTPAELRRLKQAQAFLWKVRFGLHVMTGRHEDRLLFDHQIKLARTFGYEDASYTLAVEQFMQRYYRTVMDVSLLNELLLQLFREAILTENEPPRPLNARFQVRNGSLETTSEEVFARTPSALLELFAILQQNPQIKGVRASTMRGVARNLWLIDEEFRQNPRHHRLFLDMLRASVGVTHELRRMNTYGVLGRYIPAFGRIVGRMQYDLFHAYTVDAHTLFVVSNLRRLALPRYNQELPELSRIMQSLPKSEIVYLAALFHDIAKGRGGDHSDLGAVDAAAFCLEQGLSRYEARLVAWLVANHLSLSITAQKQDIGDPEVITAFARHVGDETHLDYLYVLTCADVRGTNPRLWNSWKASLFHEFYERVKRALRRGLSRPRGSPLCSRTYHWRRLSAPGCASPRPISCATPPPKSHGTRACSPSAMRTAMNHWLGSNRAASAARPRCSYLHACAATALRARLRCSISWGSPSSMRASHRRATASVSTCITCSRTTARRLPTTTGRARSNARCGARSIVRMIRHLPSRAARRARCACSTRRRASA
jgi:[protein-PII] uridylyltransferase